MKLMQFLPLAALSIFASKALAVSDLDHRVHSARICVNGNIEEFFEKVKPAYRVGGVQVIEEDTIGNTNHRIVVEHPIRVTNVEANAVQVCGTVERMDRFDRPQ